MNYDKGSEWQKRMLSDHKTQTLVWPIQGTDKGWRDLSRGDSVWDTCGRKEGGAMNSGL